MTGRHNSDAPLPAKYRKKMTPAALAADEVLNGGKDRKVGFVLLVFPFGEKEGRCDYISNGADPRDIVALFKEQIRRIEGQPDIEGQHQ